MYLPPAFANQNLEALHEAIRSNPLGTLVTAAPTILANHVPFVLHAGEGSKGLGTLRAHLARGNDQAGLGPANVDALAIFLGVEHYITPSWYKTKRQTGKVVPTWNYVAVHATGRLRVIDDPAWVARQIETLTDRHEGSRDAPWAVSDAPNDFIAAQLRGIVGIEIDIRDLQGKWKLSQNRNAADRQGVAEGLRQGRRCGGPRHGGADRAGMTAGVRRALSPAAAA